MPNATEEREKRVKEATAQASKRKKPNLSKIAREFGVPYRTLYGRVHDGKQGRTARTPVNKALNQYQEKALVQWVSRMSDAGCPITAEMLREWADLTLARGGSDHRVGKMWGYRFMERLPEDLKLRLVKQKIKEKKRFEAEDVGYLQHWYDQLAVALTGVKPSLVYNFDECGFQVGQGKPEKVLSTRKAPEIAGDDHGENITAIECIAADGWVMEPMFIFKGAKKMESWFDHWDNPGEMPDIWTAVSPSGYISDEIAVEWIKRFHLATRDRVGKGEKRVLIFDGHGSHTTTEFLQLCEEYDIRPLCFRPHTTHLCQPLDGKPFLAYKHHFRTQNNRFSQWGGIPSKADFLKDIIPVRNKTFNQRIIRNSFKERGICPPDGSAITQKLQDTLPPVPDLLAPDLRTYGETTPPPNLSSSSIENTPPKSAQDLEKNQKKLSKIFSIEELTPKLQRGLQRALEHQKIQTENLAMMNDTVERMRQFQEPRKRQKTRREIPSLNSSIILSVKDANRSIVDRREKDRLKEEERLLKQLAKTTGKKPPKRPTPAPVQQGDLPVATGQENELFFVDMRGELL